MMCSGATHNPSVLVLQLYRRCRRWLWLWCDCVLLSTTVSLLSVDPVSLAQRPSDIFSPLLGVQTVPGWVHTSVSLPQGVQHRIAYWLRSDASSDWRRTTIAQPCPSHCGRVKTVSGVYYINGRSRLQCGGAAQVVPEDNRHSPVPLLAAPNRSDSPHLSLLSRLRS